MECNAKEFSPVVLILDLDTIHLFRPSTEYRDTLSTRCGLVVSNGLADWELAPHPF